MGHIAWFTIETLTEHIPSWNFCWVSNFFSCQIYLKDQHLQLLEVSRSGSLEVSHQFKNFFRDSSRSFSRDFSRNFIKDSCSSSLGDLSRFFFRNSLRDLSWQSTSIFFKVSEEISPKIFSRIPPGTLFGIDPGISARISRWIHWRISFGTPCEISPVTSRAFQLAVHFL